MLTETIPVEVKKLIEEYSKLKLGNKEVVTPYYINSNRKRDLRAMIGKGTPEEIIVEAKIWEKLKGVDFDKMSSDEIKEFLTEKGIGIDCSGFVAHVLNEWHKEKTGRAIWNDLKPANSGITWKIKYMLRPVENLGAETLTDEDNTVAIKLNDVRPGDLIRSKAKKNNGSHVMLVSEVTRDDSKENSPVVDIKYIHSSPYFGKNNGIKEGEIKITDLNKPLQEQEWLEQDENGVKHTLEGYMVNVSDNGLRRVRCFA